MRVDFLKQLISYNDKEVVNNVFDYGFMTVPTDKRVRDFEREYNAILDSMSKTKVRMVPNDSNQWLKLRRTHELKLIGLKKEGTRRTLKNGSVDKRFKRMVRYDMPINTMTKQCYLCTQNTVLHIHSTTKDFSEITGMPTYFLVPKKVYVYDDMGNKTYDDNAKPIRKEIKVRKTFVICVKCWYELKGTPDIVFNKLR